MTVLIGSFLTGVFLQIAKDRFLPLRKPGNFRLFSKWAAFREFVHRIVVVYLLVHIGLIGGAEVAGEGLTNMVMPGLLSLGLAAAVFSIALWMLSRFRILDRQTRISLATHFGSVSVGTFAAVQLFLVEQGIPFDPSASAWLALMEVPSILAGAGLLGGGLKSLKQTLRDRDILLLLSSMVAGYILGPGLVHKLDLILVAPFEAVLAYFLFDMGQQAGEYMPQLRSSGAKLILFGITMPTLGGILGAMAGTLAGMDTGNVILLSTLSASASYVAATAAMGKLVSPQAIATSLTVSLGITLPWNILIGIHFYTAIAKSLQNINPQSILNAFAIQTLPEVVMWPWVVMIAMGTAITIALIWSNRKVLASASEYASRWIGRCFTLIIWVLEEIERACFAVSGYGAHSPTYFGKWNWSVLALTRCETQTAVHQAFLSASATWPPSLVLAAEAVSCHVPP